MGMGKSGPIDRREFLKRSALAGVGIGLAPLAVGAEKRPPGVRRHTLLGRTGLRVSDIGFGGSRLAGDEALVRHALDRGITHFDTAEGYTDGESEKTLGRALSPTSTPPRATRTASRRRRWDAHSRVNASAL
jgi:hypothetical protein